MRTLLSVLIVGALLGHEALAGQWHMPTPYPEGEHHTRNLREFAGEVRTATDGELNIVVHSGASLYQHPEIHRAVRSGQVPIGEMLMGLLGNDDPLFRLDNLPFLATDFESAHDLWQASKPELERVLERQGLLLLYAVPWPPQGLYSNTTINSASDLEGVKLRVYSPLTSRLAALLGATPVNVQAPEIAQAFSTGIIEAMFTSPSTGVSSQAWDFVDVYTDTRAWIPKNMVIVNRRAFRRLPPAHQKALREAAARAESRGWEMVMEETEEKTRELSRKGIEVREPGEVLAGELRELGAAMLDDWLQDTGASGRKILDAYEQARD